MKTAFTAVLGLVSCLLLHDAAAQIVFYEHEGFRGRVFTANGPINNFDFYGFNDRASSAVVEYGSWQVCDDAYYVGQCATLRPGQYPSLGAFGLNSRISSVRPVYGPDWKSGIHIGTALHPVSWVLLRSWGNRLASEARARWRLAGQT